jgi:hypothetical protein
MLALLRETVIIAPAAAALALLLVLINGVSDPLLALLLGLISLFFALAVSSLLRSNRKSYARKTLRDGLAECLYMVVYYRSRKGSYLNAIDRASASSDSQALRSLMSRASKAFKLGGSFLGSIGSAEELKSDALLENLNSGLGDERAINGIVSAHGLYMNARQAAVEDSSQRYAILNMFVSTILPSFALFAFVGSTIISQAGFSLITLSVLLLVVIPLIYALGNSIMWRRLFA